MTKPLTRSTIRYAAKQCYQLALMRGRYSSVSIGLRCTYSPAIRQVIVTEPDSGKSHMVPVPAAWAHL